LRRDGKFGMMGDKLIWWDMNEFPQKSYHEWGATDEH